MTAPERNLVDVLDVLTDEAPSSRSLEALQDLIHPLSLDDFLTGYFEKKPLLIKRNYENFYGSIVQVSDVDDLLATTNFYKNEIRLAKEGTLITGGEISDDGIINRESVWSHFEGGATIIFEHLSRKHSRLHRLMASLEQDIRLPFRANAYLTPSSSRGFSLHYDTHDVLILQVSGSKDWQIYDSPMALPHESQGFTPVWRERARLLAEVQLEPGDLLYLPRGFIHGASANTEASFHITIGMRSVTQHDICMAALKRLLISKEEFRPAFLFSEIDVVAERARAMLLECIDEIDIQRSVNEAALSFIKKRLRPVEGRLTYALANEQVDALKRFKVVDGFLYHREKTEHDTTIYFDRVKIKFPGRFAPSIEVALSGNEFSAAEFADLDDIERRALIKSLLQHRVVGAVN